MKTKFLSITFLLLIKSIFSQVSFQEHILLNDNYSTEDVKALFTADLDGDGYKDLLFATSDYDTKLGWYKNNQHGGFEEQRIISADVSSSWAYDVKTADLDNDGDLDVVAALKVNDKIIWYQNDGQGNFGNQKIIKDNAYNVKYLAIADFDNDGNLDVAAGYDNTSYYNGDDGTIAWFKNDGNGTFGTAQIIDDQYEAYNVSSIQAGDINKDGKIDLIVASRSATGYARLNWYKQITNGFDKKNISTQGEAFAQLVVTDINNDTYLDIVYVSEAYSSGFVAWIENKQDETFSFHKISNNSSAFPRASTVTISDVNHDGKKDILCGSFSRDKIAWFKNVGSAETDSFEDAQIIAENNFPSALTTLDIDNDNYQDLIIASNDDENIIWYQNNQSSAFINKQPISHFVKKPSDIMITDIDGDQYLDIIVASKDDQKISWFKGSGTTDFSQQKIIANNNDISQIADIEIADMDNDGKKDIIYATEVNKIGWVKNNGNGSFNDPQIISTAVSKAKSVFVADINGDGHLDVLSASYDDDKIAWYANDGTGVFGTQQIISTTANAATDVFAADLDGDGDLDVISTSIGDDVLAWYANDGTGSFGTKQNIATNVSGATAIKVADINGDGNNDILICIKDYHKIVWFANDGNGTFSTQNVIATGTSNVIYQPNNIAVADIDNDGDLDVATASGGNTKIIWFKNNGTGVFNTQPETISDSFNGSGIFITDINEDNKKDVFVISSNDNNVSWFENSSNLSTSYQEMVSFNVLPNPAQNFIQIKSEKDIASIQVYNLLGKRILNNLNKKSINISSLKKGVYLLKIKDKKGDVGVKKIIKQ